jgi:23S rRNA (guanosine2251-2'-O)-methyltransferase
VSRRGHAGKGARGRVGRGEVVAGVQPVLAALKARPGDILRICLAAESSNQRVKDIALLAADQGVEVETLPRELVAQLAGLDRHQDVVAELSGSGALGEKDLGALLDGLAEDPLLLVLDGVTDPHNLGACLRTAEAAGAHAVIVPRDRASGLTPTVRKASAGASEIVPLVQVTNLARTLRSLKERGVWLAGTVDRAEQDIFKQDLTGPLALVMGSEGAGLRRLTAETCDYLLGIPMAGVIESLNVSVATGVCLFEIRRQRRAKRAVGGQGDAEGAAA